MPRYDFLFPDGNRASVSLSQELKPYDVVRSRSELFRIGRVEPAEVVGHRTAHTVVELEPLAARAPVVGGIHEVPNSR